MFTSEATTRGVRVQVVARYSPERSQPSGNKWFFLYTVTIVNEGSETVQLLTRTGPQPTAPATPMKSVVLASSASSRRLRRANRSSTRQLALPTPFGISKHVSDGDGAWRALRCRIAPVTLSEPYTVRLGPPPHTNAQSSRRLCRAVEILSPRISTARIAQMRG